MASFQAFRRRPCRVFSLRTILVAVPSVWLVVILWTVYNAQVVQQAEYRRQLEEFNRQGDYGKVQAPSEIADVKVRKENHADIRGNHEDSMLFKPLKPQRGAGAKKEHRRRQNVGVVRNVVDEDQVAEQLPDQGNKVLEVDNYGQDGAIESVQDNDNMKEDEEEEESVPRVIQDFIDTGQHGEALFQQPEPQDWDVKENNDHIEFSWSEPVPAPKKKIIKPGIRFDSPKLGEYGKAVRFDPNALSPQDRANFDEGWKNHQYNEFASLQISTQRETPDFRNNVCKQEDYGDLSKLPKASVIICFYNEAWSVLLRTIHSVLSKSPPELIEEIILVDDFSDMVTMHKPLEFYVTQVAKIRLLRMTKRSGLVRARLAGVRRAKAPVLIFLDSHVECATGWLPPLLKAIADHPKVAVTPEIDVIDHKTFAIQAAIDNIGILDFRSFSFDWSPIIPRLQAKRKSAADLIESPTMAGGLFAIRKDYFIQLGTYDTDLELWGGENIELSLKLWMCGGGIMIHPCSRVAHIFRDQSPYLKGSKVNVLNKNSARVAQVWADDYRKIYFKWSPYDEEKYGSVEERLKLKKDLKCRSFSWYVDNIYPEMHVDGTGRYLGQIQDLRGRCIHRASTAANSPLSLISCNRAMRWEMTRIHEIRSKGLCLDHSPRGLIMPNCDLSSQSQRFEYTQDKTIRHPETNTCLTSTQTAVVFMPCTGDTFQTWIWAENPNYMPPQTPHTSL